MMLVHSILDELYENLSIGVALEVVTLFLELFAELGIVLDDSVMDDGNVAILGNMRVSVTNRRLSVGSPTGVSNINRAKPNVAIYKNQM